MRNRPGEVELLIDDGANAYLHEGGVLSEIDASSDTTYGLTDGLGSVRGLTDESGTLTGSTSYDAFGSVTNQSGTTSTFSYTGEQTDLTGNVHLRARAYDPEVGRFLSADTVQPNAPGTQGYNRYVYVANNPTTWTDPTGHAVTVTVVQPVLHPAWFAIGLVLGFVLVAEACSITPMVCTTSLGGLAIFAIVVFAIVACVLEIGGPCWTLQNMSFDLPAFERPFTETRDTTQPQPMTPSQPAPTPAIDPNCIDNPWSGGGKGPEWKSDIPPVSNQKLQNHINALFKDGDTVPGGTAGAIRQERNTGQPTGGRFHQEKGERSVQGLSNLIKSGRLNAHDQAIAEWLENDLLNALLGCQS